MQSPKFLRIGVHVIGWLMLFSLIIAFVSVFQAGALQLKNLVTPSHLLFLAVFLFLFYFNDSYLLPKLYLPGKYVPYFLITALFLLVIWLLKPFENLILHPAGHHPIPDRMPSGQFPGNRPPLPRPRRNRIDFISIILFFMTWSLSTALRIMKQWRNTEQRAAQAEADKANAELSFLKAQINPHFLFNTLNNIYALALTQNEHTAGSILKLSQIMRYVTDEVRQDYVPLESELECITNFIDLQRLRLTNKVEIDVSVEGKTGNLKIAPLVLMTFIENVFKYGISSHEPCRITIRICAGDHKIHFFCQNRVFPNQRLAESTGIGIDNTKKRLNYLYPGRHQLKIAAEGGLFTVELTLQL